MESWSVMNGEEDVIKFINIRDLVLQQRLDLILKAMKESKGEVKFRVIMKEWEKLVNS